jgi:glyoxylase-like metal-dependent hydrolase (beta-lactamase superfamily II)
MSFAPTQQVPGVYHRRLGDYFVTALHDGYLDGSLDIVLNLDLPTAEALQGASFRRSPPRLTVTCFAISGPFGTAIVDAGGIQAFMPNTGQLPAALAAAGIAPDSVNALLMTHLHPDHIGSLLDPATGGARFPKAELILHEKEAAFWLSAETLAAMPEDRRPMVQAAQSHVAPYSARLRRVTGGEVLPGIRAVPLPGHTPGHTGWEIQGGGETLLIWGDVVHLPAIQLAHPEAGLVFDSDLAQARETRLAVLERAAAERLLVAGIHLDFPCFSHVGKQGEDYRLVPEPFTSAL